MRVDISVPIPQSWHKEMPDPKTDRGAAAYHHEDLNQWIHKDHPKIFLFNLNAVHLDLRTVVVWHIAQQCSVEMNDLAAVA